VIDVRVGFAHQSDAFEVHPPVSELQQQLFVDRRSVLFLHLGDLLFDLADICLVELVWTQLFELNLAKFLESSFGIEIQVGDQHFVWLTGDGGEYPFAVVDEFRLCLSSAEVLKEMTEVNRVVVVDLNFDRGLLLLHLHVDLDLGADESRLRHERLLDADDFLGAAEVLEDGLVLWLVCQFNAAPNQVALTDLLQDVDWRGTGFLSHDARELRFDAVYRLHTVVVDVHLDAAYFRFQVYVQLVQHVHHV